MEELVNKKCDDCSQVFFSIESMNEHTKATRHNFYSDFPVKQNQDEPEKIPEPFVDCNFCFRTIDSRIAIRAKQEMIFIYGDEKMSYPAGTTICKSCLERLGVHGFER